MKAAWIAAGESGWRIATGPADAADPDVARRARLIREAIVAAGVSGVQSVHAGLRSVLVRFDAVEVNPAAVRAALEPVVKAAGAESARAESGTGHRFSLCACPGCAPDADWIASRLQASWPEVIGRFCAAPLEVLTIGFLPGFPYLGPLPQGFDLPRLDAPRVRVPAGSVGIGGAHAGIYPFDSPGGWRLLGRVAGRLFDPARTPPARFQPGDVVEFIPRFNHADVHG